MFALTGRNLPTVRSYTAALEAYNNAHVGTNGEWRGLNTSRSGKRDSSKLVKKDGKDIVFRYHSTDLVTWRGPEHVRIEFHSSQSSATFISALTPIGLDPMRHRDMLFMRTQDNMMWADSHDCVDFRYSDEENLWKPNLKQIRTFDAFDTDLKAAARLRKKLRGFLDWKKSMERLGKTFYAEDQNLTNAMFALQAWLTQGGIPESCYLAAAHSALGDNLLKNAYVLDGVVKKVQAPLGTLPRESAYRGLPAWKYI